MNGHGMKTEWSERRQVLAVILSAGLLIFVTSYFLLLPLNRRKRQLQIETRAMTDHLIRQNYGGSEQVLSRRKAAEEHLYKKLREQWKQTAERMAAFSEQPKPESLRVGHIDFKVALFEVRKRLRLKSKTVAVDLPYDLGMDDEVNSEEDARKLILQLRAVEKVLDMALDLKMQKIHHVEPLPPVEYPVPERPDVYMEEYPVFLSFSAGMQTLYDLINSTLEPGNACFFRRLHTENIAPSKDLLEVSAVIGATLFPKRLEELGWPTGAGSGTINPAGY